MSENEYLIYWLVYSVAASLFFVWFWFITRWKTGFAANLWWLASFLRICLLIVLATPAQQAPESSYYAPAWITMIFDEMQGLPDGALRAGINLMMASVFGGIFYLVHLILGIILFVRRKRT